MSDRPLFRFEDFEDIKPLKAQEAAIEAALYELHPKGTPVAALEETLKKAGADYDDLSFVRTKIGYKQVLEERGINRFIGYSDSSIEIEIIKITELSTPDGNGTKIKVDYIFKNYFRYLYKKPRVLWLTREQSIYVNHDNSRNILGIRSSKHSSFK